MFVLRCERRIAAAGPRVGGVRQGFFSGGGGNPRAAAAQPAGDWPEKSAGSDASRPAEKPRGAAAGAAVAAAASARHTHTRRTVRGRRQ